MAPNREIIVPVPLDEYFELLSAHDKLTRPVRTRAQAAREKVAKVTDMVTSRLPVLSQPAVRGRKRTEISCLHLESEIERSLRQFSRYYRHPDVDPLFDVFYTCRAHYLYFYDEESRQMIEQYQQRIQDIFRSRKYNDLSWGAHDRYPRPQTEAAPVLAEYMSRLPVELQPALPLYIACHFISKPNLSIPIEIEQAICSS